MSYCVYIHTNKHDGKKYVGITSKTPEERWNYGGGYAANEHFTRAIKKYGWKEGFTHEVVMTGLTADEAAELEQYLIAKYDSNNPEHGYNQTRGGFGYDKAIGNATYKLAGRLPAYSEIKENEAALRLFEELLALAYGGRELKTVTRRYRGHECVSEETVIEKTEPDKEVIEVILKNYAEEPELQRHISELKTLLGE